MSIEKTFGHFFKPEIRQHGEGDFKEGLVKVSSSSDIQIEAFLRVSSAPKLKLQSASMESKVFTAQCSCTSGKKGNFCRHIWALLLHVEKNHPDFLDSKNDIQMSLTEDSPEKQAMKEKQKSFRQAAYEKVKIKAKEQRSRLKEEKKQQKASSVGKPAKGSKNGPNYSGEALEAIQYFQKNGFDFSDGIDEQELKSAKKELSRVFHPDRGGTHDEILELQKNFDILQELL